MKQTYILHSYEKLVGYMKKFSSIEKSLLFEIIDDEIVAKTHTPDKSVVKISRIMLSDILNLIPSKSENDSASNIKIGLFAIDNFISSFKYFDNNEIKLEIDYLKVNSNNVATELKAISKTLKISFPCASMTMFRYIDDELAAKITNTDESLFSFRIDKDALSKISALSGLDNDNEIISIETNKSREINFKGKSFELNIPGVVVENEGKISFHKSHFSFVDKEDSEIFVTDSKIIFKSLETNTIICIGKVE